MRAISSALNIGVSDATPPPWQGDFTDHSHDTFKPNRMSQQKRRRRAKWVK